MNRQASLFAAEEPVVNLPSAVFSDDGAYRYVLTYPTGEPGDRRMVALLHNPSVATPEKPDATAATVTRLARRERCAWLTIVNPFAAVATDKRELLSMADPVGPENVRHLLAQLDLADIHLAGWGRVHKKLQPRLDALLPAIDHFPWLCVGANSDGSPKHPLYMRSDTPLVRW